ncbi:MAG: hypothetical protein ACRCVV_04065 [Shewanella sp.]
MTLCTTLRKTIRCLNIIGLALMLTACVAPLLLISPQGQLMWALLKPLVGLNPNDVGLFEQPLIKDRMYTLLGDNYDTTMSLLKTADKIQQEGPLFYLVSTYTPAPELAEKAGLVWNSQNNQMAAMLITGGAPLVMAEQLNQQADYVIPSWPKELADYTDPQKLQQKALEAGSEQLQQPRHLPAASATDNAAISTDVIKTLVNEVKPAPVTPAAETAPEKQSPAH